MQDLDVDIAIVGSGFAGSLTALALRRRGMSVALVERGRHPRFAIGESSTPLANLLLEHLADRYDLPRIRVFSKWGTWQRARPDVAGGLKRGFTFLFHRPGERFPDDRRPCAAAAGRRQSARRHRRHALVPAGLRPRAGARGRSGGRDLPGRDASRSASARTDVRRRRSKAHVDGRALRISARFVDRRQRSARISPSGAWSARPHRCSGCRRRKGSTRTSKASSDGIALQPSRRARRRFRVDDAALHHVFDGGWMWMLRFNNGITSAGVALTDRVAAAVRAGEGAPAWDRILDESAVGPRSVSRRARRAPLRARAPARVPEPRSLRPQVGASSLGRRRDRSAAVDRLPADAAGHHPTARRAGEHGGWTGARGRRCAPTHAPRRTSWTPPSGWSRRSTRAWPIRRCSNASPCSTSRRRAMRKPRGGLAGASWRQDSCSMPIRNSAPSCARARSWRVDRRRQAPESALLDRIDRAIEPFDVAGLLDRSRRDWYPVLADDLVKNAWKLNASAEEIERLLERCGFVARSTRTGLPRLDAGHSHADCRGYVASTSSGTRRAPAVPF